MTAFDEFCKDFEAQEKRIREQNVLWRKELQTLRLKYWNNPKMKDAILNATESISQTES